MIRSTFKRLLDQHWVGIRKDQGQTEVSPRESYLFNEVDEKGIDNNQTGVNPSVPFSIFLVTKGKESFV